MTTTGPLAGIRVLDLTHIAAGPFATMLLADLGADVIKIERPETGDGARQMDVSIRDMASGYYLGLNKNKRSIALDLTCPSGVGTVLDLATTADVFVENFRPGAADRLGLGYDATIVKNPKIVYCSITGFGPTGPDSDQLAYDIIGQARSGIMSITGETDQAPAKCGAPISDLGAGLFAAIGILAALHHRDRTGEGQHIGASLLGSSTALLASYVTSHALGTRFDRVGSAHNTLAPYQAFAGSDARFFIVAAGNDGFFIRTLDAIGASELMSDPRFTTNSSRTLHRRVLAALLQKVFYTQTSEYWTHVLGNAGVPVSPISGLDEMVNDPQVRANRYVVDVEQPGIGVLPMVLAPLTFSATPVTVRRSAPALDEHHDEIMAIAAEPRRW